MIHTNSTTGGKRILVVGGPNAGKTNYIGRLWLDVETKNSILRQDGLPNNLTYLHELRKSILQGEYAPRSNPNYATNVKIPFKLEVDQGNSKTGVLEVPDCNGEMWRDVYRNREWPGIWDDYLDDMCGCLLFVRVASDENQAALDWVTLIRMFGHPVKPAKKADTPTQVYLVDWLQIINSLRISDNWPLERLRLGIVITAWDLVPGDQQNMRPSDWLAREFPMLGQYLEAHVEEYDLAVFGVSAFGGDLKNPASYVQEFLTRGPQNCGYALFVDNDGVVQRSDITLPVAWCLGTQLP